MAIMAGIQRPLGGGMTMQQWEAQKKANAPSPYLQQAVAATGAANKANKQRELEVRAIYDEMINRYQPGGAFETKSLQQIEKQKSRFVEQGYGQAIQGDISRGIYGTTESGARKQRLEKGYEADVAAPSRLRLEDVLMQRLSSAQQGMAGFLTGIEDQGPSLSQLYSMGSQAGSSSGGGFSSTTIDRGSSSPSISSTIPTARTIGQSAKGTSSRIPGYTGGVAGQSLWASGGSKAPLSTGSTSGVTKPHVQSFQSYFNYSATLFNKTGKKVPQQQAYSELIESGWKG
jgi:hypothetical protein